MNNIHPSDEEALQTIDAAVFTGDPEIIRERLSYFIGRWTKALAGSNAVCDDCGINDRAEGEVSCGDCLDEVQRRDEKNGLYGENS